jgi:hypothetical protein
VPLCWPSHLGLFGWLRRIVFSQLALNEPDDPQAQSDTLDRGARFGSPNQFWIYVCCYEVWHSFSFGLVYGREN